MQPLDRTSRNQLERTVKEARQVSESAARSALQQLGVGDDAPFLHLSPTERELRRKLRIHGRQLGDSLNGGKIQTLDRLVEEIAYEHWHRMLFARFLAENNLLMYPDPANPVAVTLEECTDLAADEGAADGWDLASRFSARMLPQIFRPDSPVFLLSLPPEHQHKLERLLADLPPQVFTASDSLGWVYQFWQAKKKEDINASEVKIGARELPAVTQLFTESYMVSFLLDNSLGAWWVSKVSGIREQSSGELRPGAREKLLNAKTEEELREFFCLPGVPLQYLRFIRINAQDKNPASGNLPPDASYWMPAAGIFNGWPEHLSELKTLDPCAGSGHFMVAAFLMLLPMRMELESLSAREAADRVLSKNIHGLEIDQRCIELAAFALALAAWKYPDAGGYRLLPQLHLACSGLAVSAKEEEWLALAAGDNNLRLALRELYKQFKDAPVLGSLINPEAGLQNSTLLKLGWDKVGPLLTKALASKKDDEKTEMGVVAHGLSKAAMLLAGQYHWVITNVPYLWYSNHCDRLRDFCGQQYPEAKKDLATVFLDRCLQLCMEGGAASIVLPQNWLFLTSYKNFRIKLLQNDTWRLIARLGPGAFETISGEVVKAILLILRRGNQKDAEYRVKSADLFASPAAGSPAPAHFIRGLDVSELRTAAEKAAALITAEIKSVEQAKQLENPDARVALEESDHAEILGRYTLGLAGILNGDSPRFLKQFWEIFDRDDFWSFQQTTQEITTDFGGLHNLVYYDEINGHLREEKWIRKERLHNSDQRGQSVVGKKGIAVSSMGILPVSRFLGSRFDSNVAAIVPHNPIHLLAIWCFCSSPQYNEAVRRIDQSLKVTNAILVKVPFDLDHWTQIAAEKYPHGLPKPFSDDPTQWIFHGHPCGSVVWDEEKKWTVHGPLRTDAAVLQTAVARLLGYRWPAELDAEMELADEQRQWVKRCRALHPFADEDGIVCIPPVRGEASAADRLLNLLAAAYGESWSNEILSQLLKQADHAGKTLDTWLRDKFFIQHCRLFQHRPFIWHIWDGLREGFAALVNCHKLDHKNLETLIYTYLGDWISRQKQDIAKGVDGAQERLAAAENLKKKLELILKGEKPCDIFVHWKPLKKQPIGWNPDLNDGVRLNIRPFLTVPDVGRKGAGVLRDKPNISWDKDRGKDVESAPWYHLFKGERINDHHLTLQEKQASRETRP